MSCQSKKIRYPTEQAAESAARDMEAKYNQPFITYECLRHFHIRHLIREQGTKRRGKYVICEKCGFANTLKRAHLHRCTVVKSNFVEALTRVRESSNDQTH